jgi:polyisoprenyl-teichoic acid--peptidoglycan teichoic acid transferase
MARKKTSMDGFVPRRPNRRVGGVIGGEKEPTDVEDPAERPQLGSSESPQTLRSHISRSEIDESLRNIDEEDENQPPRRKRRTPGEKHSPKRKWIKRIALLLVIILLAIGLYVGIKAIIASSNVFQGSIFDIFQNAPLKEDKNGRSNIIIVGTSEDDPGHEGGSLTDSMMIMSVDQKNKNAFLISIPRDLYVKFGRACNSGYTGKINEYYNCVHDGDGVDADRKALTKEADFIGDIVGLDIQYGVNVNYTVMRELVNAVGGSITVTIESRDPRGQMDSNFDWHCGVGNRKYTRAMILKRCPPNGHFIDYPNGPATLDAEHALYLAQARGDAAPTYGFEQSNFDREKNQQKIIKALRVKAASAGVLADFGKVSAIIDALGNNLRTTFETKEFRTLVSLAQDIKNDDIKSISLVDGDDPVMGTGNVNGISVVRPNAGTYDYSDLRALLKKRLSSDPIVRESAPIAVFNGSGVAGVAQAEADNLETANYTIETIATAPKGNYPHFTLYQIGSGNAGTAEKLKQRYGVKITSGKPPVTVGKDVKFVLIIGPEPVDTSTQ